MRNKVEQANDTNLNIHIGKATICFDSKKLVWVKLGGDYIFSERRARQYCQKMADLMSPKKCA